MLYVKRSRLTFEKNCFGRNFAFSIGLFPVLVLLSTAQEWVGLFQSGFRNLSYPFHATLLLQALGSPFLLASIPILAALPGSASFMEEQNTGFIHHVLPRLRGGYASYCRRKSMSVAISGGLALSAGLVVAYVFLAMVLTPFETVLTVSNVGQSDSTRVVTGSGILVQKATETGAAEQAVAWIRAAYIPEVLSYGLLLFLAGAIWALAGALCSLLLSSRYTAYFSPFVLYYFLVILSERYLPHISVLRPGNWLLISPEWPGGTAGTALLAAELIAILVLLYGFILRRRITSV